MTYWKFAHDYGIGHLWSLFDITTKWGWLIKYRAKSYSQGTGFDWVGQWSEFLNLEHPLGICKGRGKSKPNDLHIQWCDIGITLVLPDP